MCNFLFAILTNDLFKACQEADENNMSLIPVYAALLYNKGPMLCYGSVKKFDKWRETGGLNGLGPKARGPVDMGFFD